MKHLKSTLTLMLSLLFSVGLQAQNFVTGNNLNIGSGNSFGSYGNETYGNAIGVQNHVEGANTLVVGYCDTVAFGSTNSFVAGSHNSLNINNINSFAIGGNVKVNGAMSVGIGYYLKPGNEKSIIIGKGVEGNNNIPFKLLQNNYPNTLMIGMNSTKPTLTIGPSPNNYPNGDTLTKTGKVAIGDVPVPHIAAKLHIRSDYGEDAGVFLEPKDPMTSNTFIRMRDENHGVEVDKDGVMIVKSSTTHSYNGSEVPRPIILKGIVGVNIDNYYYEDLTGAYGLWVKGGIKTEKVTIKYYGSWWSDYVFNVDYPLMPLNDLRVYIRKNHHLPDVPSEAEVMDNGIELGNMQSVLLKKIEELTLYTLKQQDEIEALKQTIEELKGK